MSSIPFSVGGDTLPAGESEGTCPVCDREGYLVIRPRRDKPQLWSVHCRSETCDPPGGESTWLQEVAETLSTAECAITPGQVLAEPHVFLADYCEDETTHREPRPLPSHAAIMAKHKHLLRTPAALAYMTDERLLTLQTLRRARVGLEGSVFTFPLYERLGADAGRRLVNIIRRPFPRDDRPPYYGERARDKSNGGIQLYPHRPRGKSVLLVAGLLDALLGAQELPGVAVVSPSHGVRTFEDEWFRRFAGRRVAVMFDVGEERTMNERVAQLRHHGAEAWPVYLSKLFGEEAGGGDLTDALRAGFTAEDILKLINDAQ